MIPNEDENPTNFAYDLDRLRQLKFAGFSIISYMKNTIYDQLRTYYPINKSY